MSATNRLKKMIHFPGDGGQRRQANYVIVEGQPSLGPIILDTTIAFIADPTDPGKYSPTWETVMSLDHDSCTVPNYLLNKVLEMELSGCRLDYIKVFFVTEPSAANRRDVYRWNFRVDCDNPIGHDPYRTTVRTYGSYWDKIKAIFRIPCAEFEIRGLTLGIHQKAGVYPVEVDIKKPVLPEKERLELLEAIGLTSGSV